VRRKGPLTVSTARKMIARAGERAGLPFPVHPHMLHPEWLQDPRFKTPALRQQHIDARLALTQEVLRTRSSAEWLQRLEAADVPCAPVLTRGQMIAHPQVIENGILVETEHPRAGRLRQARPAARFSRTPTAIARGAPRLGEHGRELLTTLGYDKAEIAELCATGVVGFPDGDDKHD